MKRIGILIFLVFIMISVYAGKPVTKNKVSYSCTYTRAEDYSVKEFWLTNCCSGTSENIVRDQESAAMLAYIYVKNLYGDDVAQKEQPYKIGLVNDSIWCINGTSREYKKKKWKGNFIIAIDKKTGKLLAYMHEK